VSAAASTPSAVVSSPPSRAIASLARQVGERVVVGQVPDASLGGLALGDVGQQALDQQPALLVEHARGLVAHPDDAAVAGVHPVLDGDPLNRRRFLEELELEVAATKRGMRSSAAIVLDVDGFKFVNDSLGHQAGDELIRTVARTLAGRLV
jgi:hypothetical protein